MLSSAAMKKPKRLLLPTTLMLTTACPHQQRPPCDSDPYDQCGPDGGYWCPGEGCANAVDADGGVLREMDGRPVCLC